MSTQLRSSSLSTPAAQAAFTRCFAGPLRGVLESPLKCENSSALGETIGSLWMATYTELQKLDGDRAHQPDEGRTLVQDLEDTATAPRAPCFRSVHPEFHEAVRRHER